jgi:hypothetical protein
MYVYRFPTASWTYGRIVPAKDKQAGDFFQLLAGSVETEPSPKIVRMSVYK